MTVSWIAEKYLHVPSHKVVNPYEHLANALGHSKMRHAFTDLAQSSSIVLCPTLVGTFQSSKYTPSLESYVCRHGNHQTNAHNCVRALQQMGRNPRVVLLTTLRLWA